MTTQISTEGNLTADPTVRYTTNGKPVATLRIAVSDRRRKGEEYVDTVTVFYDVEVWGKPAENAANSFRKGDRITVTGQHYLRPWTDQAATSGPPTPSTGSPRSAPACSTPPPS